MKNRQISTEKLYDSYFQRGNFRLASNKYDEAIEDYNEAIKLNPHYARSYKNRGLAYYTKGDISRAIDDYTKAIELDPDNAYVYNNRGTAYSEKGEFSLALKDLNRAIELKPDLAEAYFYRGVTYYRNGDVNFAIEDYNTAIKLRYDYARAYNNRGIAYRDKGDVEHAIEDYSKAIELYPAFVEAYSNRGRAYVKKGLANLALRDCNEAIRLNPNFADAYNNRGLAYERNGDVEHAIEDYTKAIQLKPDYAEAYSNRGMAYDKKDAPRSAKKDYTKATQLKHDGIGPEVYNYLKARGLEEKLRIAETFLDTAEFLEMAPFIATVGESAENIENRKDKQRWQRKGVCHFLYAIVFELAIKIIWESDKGEKCRQTHDILSLYTELSNEKQAKIQELYDRQLSIIKAQEGESQGKKIHVKDLTGFQSLNEALKANKETVRDFKYDGKFRGKSSAIGGVIWNNQTVWIFPERFVIFPKELLKYARENVESLST